MMTEQHLEAGMQSHPHHHPHTHTMGGIQIEGGVSAG